MPLMSTSEKSRYLHERLKSKSKFDSRSFRTKTSGSHRLVMGCPVGKYNSRTKQCSVKMQAQSLLHPKSEFDATLKNIGSAIDKLERMLVRTHPAVVTKEIKRMLTTYKRKRTSMKKGRLSNNDIICKNPKLKNLGSYSPNCKNSLNSNILDGAVEIYEKITAIEAIKGGKRKSNFPKEKFRHEFDTPARIFGLGNGSLLVVSSDDKSLWNMFDYDVEYIEEYMNR